MHVSGMAERQRNGVLVIRVPPDSVNVMLNDTDRHSLGAATLISDGHRDRYVPLTRE